MERQEMLNAWSELQARVEKCTAQQTRLQEQLQQSKTVSIRRRTQRSPIWDLIVAGVTAIAVGGFMAGNIQELLAAPAAGLPAIAVFAFAIYLIHVSVRQLILSSELDFSKAVTETQTQLTKLRKLRLQATQWTFILALPLWFVFPILLGQMLIGAELIFALHPAWLFGNVVFGLAMIPPIYWVMKKSKYAQFLQDTIVGKEVAEAEGFLREIEAFRAE
ncbi:MAG: hypothetical protein KF784_02595 [Fimbriimonadaceae bacterium]|nr:hypothetical protein [Fimbriimonadaceae bacterium]